MIKKTSIPENLAVTVAEAPIRPGGAYSGKFTTWFGANMAKYFL